MGCHITFNDAFCFECKWRSNGIRARDSKRNYVMCLQAMANGVLLITTLFSLKDRNGKQHTKNKIK